jgi:hypothetical protein
MTNGGTGPTGAAHPLTNEELAWMAAHVKDLRRTVSEKRILRWTLAIGFVAGLVVHVGGYLLRASAAAEPLALVADLLYALGYALWTGVVVAVLVQIFPEWKQRQLETYLRAYEEAVRPKSHAADS